MADDAKLHQIEQQLMENQRSSTQLRESIEDLRVPLNTLAEIQTEQREIRATAAAAAVKAAAVEKKSDTRARTARRAVAGVLLMLLLLAGSTYLNRQAIAASQARWCPVVVPLAPRASDPPPVGSPEQQERALRIRVAFSKLVHDFNC